MDIFFFRIFQIIIFCFVGDIFDLVHDVGYTWLVLTVTATSIWKSFLKYEWCPWNCKLLFHGHQSYFRKDFQKLQFHRHHSYFRKDFQMLVTAKEGETCTRSYVATSKQKKKKFQKNKKNCPLGTKTILRCALCSLTAWAQVNFTKLCRGITKRCRIQ